MEIWSPPPPGFSLFIWRLYNNALPTKNNIFHENCAPNPNWSLCNYAIEDLDHLFRTCQMTILIWNSLYPFSINRQLSFPDWLKFHCNHKKKFKYNLSWNSFFQVLVRNIWLARNHLIFNKNPFNHLQIINSSIAESVEYIPLP